MCNWLNTNLRLLLCGGLLLLALQSNAQVADKDTAAYDTTETGLVDQSTPIRGELVEPETPTVYNSSSPSDDQWNQTTSDKAYSYRDKREYIPKEAPPEKEPGWIRFLLEVFRFFSSPTGKLLLWISLILIIGYVVYRIIRGQGSGLFAATDRNRSFDEGALSEQGLLEADWEKQMQDAMQTGDLRTAVRYGYLHLLRLLQERGYIAYR